MLYFLKVKCIGVQGVLKSDAKASNFNKKSSGHLHQS